MTTIEADTKHKDLFGEDFPEDLILVRHTLTNKYGCFCHQGTHGLAAFSLRGSAEEFARILDLSGFSFDPTSFDEAREIAKARPHPVTSLMLLDDINNPLIHYVK